MKGLDQLEGKDPSKWQPQIHFGKVTLKIIGILYFVPALLPLGLLFFVKKATVEGRLTDTVAHQFTTLVILSAIIYAAVGILFLIFSRKIDEANPNKNIFLAALIILLITWLWFGRSGISLMSALIFALAIPIYTAFRASGNLAKSNIQNGQNTPPASGI